MRRSNKPVATRGLNRNHKSATTGAIQRDPVFKLLYFRLTQRGIALERARLNLTLKLAALTIALWKKGAHYDPE